MREACTRISGAVFVVVALAATATAGWPVHACRGETAAHAAYDGSGCGPRVWGPVHEPVDGIDQCDACARFRGCHGYRQMPDLLAPWQLPPGRGFRPAQACGYAVRPCTACGPCGGLCSPR